MSRVSNQCTYHINPDRTKGNILPLDIRGYSGTMVSLRHLIWTSQRRTRIGERIRHKIYSIQCLYFRKLILNNRMPWGGN